MLSVSQGGSSVLSDALSLIADLRTWWSLDVTVKTKLQTVSIQTNALCMWVCHNIVSVMHVSCNMYMTKMQMVYSWYGLTCPAKYGMKLLTHSQSNNGYTVEVWEWMNNFIPLIVMGNLSMLGLKSIQVSKSRRVLIANVTSLWSKGLLMKQVTSTTGGPSFKPWSNVIYHITMLQGSISDWFLKGMTYILNSLKPEIFDSNSKIMIFKLYGMAAPITKTLHKLLSAECYRTSLIRHWFR